MDLFNSIFGSSGYLPHGYCFTWTPGLLWSMVGADGVIAAAYFSIPLAMTSFVRRRGASSMNGVAWLFIAFIFSCGITHLMDIWTIWHPDYGLQAFTKTITAVVSLVTAIAIWPLIPKALKIPTVDDLQSVIRRLEAESSKRRSVEDRLVDTQQSLAVSLGSIGAGFIATDRAGLITHMNAVAEKVTGWSQAQAQGQNLWTVFRRADRPADYLALNPVDRMIAEGTTLDTASHADVFARDASRTALEVKAALTHAEDGLVRGLALVFRDMTEHLLAEAARLKTLELEAENMRIQMASRLKSQFLANMSHELRTPLNAVIGFADLLKSGMVAPDSPEYLEFAGHIGSSGRHLLKLINDVLDLSKVESGTFRFFPEPVDLPLLVNGVVSELQPMIQEREIVVRVDVDPALQPVVDPFRLKQVLYNYLSNAIKFNRQAGRVMVRASAEGSDRFRLEVEDTGIGIEQHELPRLFNDFTQLDAGSSRQHGGSGLGLALTRRLAQAQGGVVGVHSVPGQGSTFYLILNKHSDVSAMPVTSIEAGNGMPPMPTVPGLQS